MKIPGLTTLRRLTIKPVEGLVGSLFLDLVKRFLSSSVKSVAAVLIAALGAAAGVPLPADQVAAWLWALALVGIRAAIAALEQLINKWPEIVAAANAVKK